MVTLFVDDFDGFVDAVTERGIQPESQETYENGVRKAIYRDPDGNELGVGRTAALRAAGGAGPFPPGGGLAEGRVSERASPRRRSSMRDPPDVAVEGVLRREADAGEHLLAVAGDGAGAAAGDGLGEGGAEREPSCQAASAAASAASMATRVSARRWRTAWNLAMGRPNCTRSRACSRASRSIVRARRRARGRAPAGRRPPLRPSDRPARRRRGESAPVSSTRPSAGSRPLDGAGVRDRVHDVASQ